jgi:hypothetical protein
MRNISSLSELRQTSAVGIHDLSKTLRANYTPVVRFQNHEHGNL